MYSQEVLKYRSQSEQSACSLGTVVKTKSILHDCYFLQCMLKQRQKSADSNCLRGLSRSFCTIRCFMHMFGNLSVGLNIKRSNVLHCTWSTFNTSIYQKLTLLASLASSHNTDAPSDIQGWCQREKLKAKTTFNSFILFFRWSNSGGDGIEEETTNIHHTTDSAIFT